jgi:hypothetical protein
MGYKAAIACHRLISFFFITNRTLSDPIHGHCFTTAALNRRKIISVKTRMGWKWLHCNVGLHILDIELPQKLEFS